MDDNDFERVRASHLWDPYVVQGGNPGHGRDPGDGKAYSKRGVAGDGLEPRPEICAIPPGVVAGGVVGLGRQRDFAAAAVASV